MNGTFGGSAHKNPKDATKMYRSLKWCTLENMCMDIFVSLFWSEESATKVCKSILWVIPCIKVRGLLWIINRHTCEIQELLSSTVSFISADAWTVLSSTHLQVEMTVSNSKNAYWYSVTQSRLFSGPIFIPLFILFPCFSFYRIALLSAAYGHPS